MASPIPALLVLAAAAAAARTPGRRFYVTPEEVRALDSRTLAERVVARVREECDLADAPEDRAPALGADFELLMMVPASELDSIADNGFLNFHQAAVTRGFARAAQRYETEQELALARLPYSRRGRALLPKYALLDVKKRGFGTYPLPSRYGEVVVAFKAEVAARATWTYADSLDFSRRAGRFRDGGAGNPVLARTVQYARKSGDRNACGNYCEAQIWGELTWDDVAYAMVPAAEPAPAAALRSGVPVYRYTLPASTSAVVAPERAAQYVRGERVLGIAPPEDARRAKPVPEGLRLEARAAALDDAALAAAVEDSTPAAAGEAPAERRRLIGELAGRPKSLPVVHELQRLFDGPDEEAREMALYGLSELPWPDFKPYLLAGLKDEGSLVEIEAVALAAERRADPDVAAALAALKAAVRRRLQDPRDAGAPDVAEWLERLDKARFCE